MILESIPHRVGTICEKMWVRRYEPAYKHSFNEEPIRDLDDPRSPIREIIGFKRTGAKPSSTSA